MTKVNMYVNLCIVSMGREIFFYRIATQKCPVEDFLDSLPSKVAKKSHVGFRFVGRLGRYSAQYFVKMPGTDDIWECRIKLGSNIYRIFAFWDENKIILTHGFIKKIQKTPGNAIEKAESYKKDYFQRKGR